MSNALRLSATSIGRYKACPTRFRNADVEGLRLEEDSDALRIGTNWHSIQEIYRNVLLETDNDKDKAFDAIIEHLNEVYATVPMTKTAVEWAVERESLVALFVGYIWYWDDGDIETLVTEIMFRLPLHHPKTGMPLSVHKVIRIGKIDRLIKFNNRLSQNEYKTTGSDISPDAIYWDKLKQNTQVSFYDLALHDGLANNAFDLKLPDLPIGGCLYDVTRKPTISPKKLTQGDTKKFMASGEYMDEKFEVHTITPKVDPPDAIKVDGWDVEITPGAKEGTFAIRETPAMYRARLVKDIMAQPEKYYARREIPLTKKDREWFRSELYDIYRSMRYAIDNGVFYHNEDQCDQFGGCDYRDLCRHRIDITNGYTPDGMKRVFTKLTVKETE